jgi:hypothetical protein
MRLTREPAAWGALLAAVISIAAVFDFPLLQGDASVAIIAVVDAVVGLWIAASVRPFAVSSVTYLIQAAVVAAAHYGLHFHQDKVAAFNAAILGLIFAVTRVQQSPKKDPGGTPDQVVSTKY